MSIIGINGHWKWWKGTRKVQHQVNPDGKSSIMERNHDGEHVTNAFFYFPWAYPMGIWQAIFCFCKNKEKAASSSYNKVTDH